MSSVFVPDWDRFLVLLLTIATIGAVQMAAFGQSSRKVAINFRGVVGERSFSCNDAFDGVGTTGSKITVSDFRMFVHDVRLVDSKGREVSVELDQDEKYQNGRVALLDFESGDGNCNNGTPELNTAIRGTVPQGKYVGVRFTLGVPFDLNHKDPTTLPAPLNVTRMMWSWQSGYKFVRIDTKTAGRPNGYVLHLGSSGCKTDEAGKTTCISANRPEFSFAKFDPAKDVIDVDLKALYAGANVDINQEKTAAGCMSSPDDGDCKPVYTSLGLAFGEAKPAAQSFMRVEKMPKGSAEIKR